VKATFPLARFIDGQSPYTEGRVGLYAEDAYAQFGAIDIASTNRSSLADASASGQGVR